MQSSINTTLTPERSWRTYFRSLDIFSLGLVIAIFSLFLSAKTLFSSLAIGSLNATALHNLLILVMIGVYGLRHGFRLFVNPLIAVYTLLLVNTFVLASRHPDLSLNQIGQSYASFILGMVLLHVNLKPSVRRLLWHMLPWMALGSVLVGLILHELGTYEAFRYLARTDVYRLQGANTPKGIAHMAIFGMLASLPLARTNRFYLGLGLVNYAIIALSASRTNIVMGLFLIGVYLWPDVKALWQSRQWSSLKHAAFVLSMVAILTLGNSSTIFSRITYTSSQNRTEIDANSSGRAYIWAKYWDSAEHNILFGRGLGAGTVAVPESESQLNVPHNEYLRLIVDGGFVGLGLILLAYAYLFWKVIQHTTFISRLYLLAGIAILAALSLLDNTLTTQTFSVLFWTWWAVVAYNSFSGEETSPRFEWNFFKIFTGFPPQVEAEQTVPEA